MDVDRYWKMREQKAGIKPHEEETYGWWMQTNAYEFEGLLIEANKLPARRILEIGTNQGGSAIFFDSMAGAGGRVVTVEHPSLLDQRPQCVIDPKYSPWRPVSTFTSVLMDSHAPETLTYVRELFQTQPIDLLFIDGDHSYEGCQMDYEMYSPLVRPGGIVAIDDVVSHPYLGQFWKGLVGEKKLVHVKAQGIGILWR